MRTSLFTRPARLLIPLPILLLVACAQGPTPRAEAGLAAYDVLAQTSSQTSGGYRLGAFDELAITVFYEPELSFERVMVDSNGSITYPFVGSVVAEGHTPQELASVISDALAAGYVVDPQVSVSVVKSAGQKIVVEGEVSQPGSFPITGRSTLLEALALAGGPQRTADLDEIIVFRPRPDGVYAARFDLQQIRAGLQPNPALEGGDTVVVGIDGAGRLYRDFVQIAPLLSVIFFRL